MERFAHLYQALDARRGDGGAHAAGDAEGAAAPDGERLAALRAYFAAAPAADAAWAVHLLAGGRPPLRLPATLLRAAACRAAGLPDWLFAESLQAVGDLAETIALVLPPGPACGDGRAGAGLAEWMEQRLPGLRGLPPEAAPQALITAWADLDLAGRFLLNKLVGGGFRPGLSRALLQRALAEHAGLPPTLIAQRLASWTSARGDPPPSAERWSALVAGAESVPCQGGSLPGDLGQPYPFEPVRPLDEPLSGDLGEAAHCWAEWWYDGLRAQLVKRGGRVWLWSADQTLLNGHFPEVVARAGAADLPDLPDLPDGTVLDGQLLIRPPGSRRPAPYSALQQRLGRRNLPPKWLAQAPAVYVVSDLLEADGRDWRSAPLQQRLARLAPLLAGLAPSIDLSPRLDAADWPACARWRSQARAQGATGLRLRRCDVRLGPGGNPIDGPGWVWPAEALHLRAVLVYAQAGGARGAGMETEVTVAVWNRPPASAEEAQAVADAPLRREAAPPGPGLEPLQPLQLLQLLPIGRIGLPTRGSAATPPGAGLTEAERAQLDQVVRATTVEKFGPVRSLRPTLVLELAFEGAGPSARHKSGLQLRLPRFVRLRPDTRLHEADSLATLRALLPPVGPGG